MDPLFARVLLAGLSDADVTLLTPALVQAGFEVRTKPQVPPSDRLRADALIVDARAAGEGWHRVLQRLEPSRRPAVVLFVDNGDPEARAQALDAGAQDYLLPPLDPRRCVERIETGLRRHGVSRTVALVDGVVDLQRGVVLRGGLEQTLTELEAGLLEHLSARPGVPISQEALLRAVWGHRCALNTRAVANTVSRLRRKIEGTPAEPVHLLTAHGQGYRFQPAPAAPRQRTGTLIGRDDLLDRLLDAVTTGPPAVTLVGPPGAGKTALAEALIRLLPRGVRARTLPLEGVRSPAELGRALALALALGPQASIDGPTGLVRAAHALAAEPSTLLILDAAEALGETLPEAVTTLLDAAPTLRLLLTSRIRLRHPQSVELGVGPLALEDAVALFRRTAPLPLGPEHEDDIATLVDALDRMPLSIGLAAGRAAMMPPGAMRQQLHARFRLLRDPSGQAPPRQQTLRAAIHSSWSLLDPWSQRALATVSVFVGRFTVDEAEQLLGWGDDPDAPWLFDVLERLHDASMLVDQHAPDTAGFLLHQSIRAFAAEQRPTVAPGAVDRYVRLTLDAAERLVEGTRGPDIVDSLDRLEVLLPQLIEIQRTAPRAEDRARAALAMSVFLMLRVSPEDEVLPLDPEPGLPPALEAHLLIQRAELGRLRGRWAHADADLDAAHRLATAAGLDALVAETNLGRALMALRYGRLDGVEDLAVDAERRFGAAGVGWGEGLSISVQSTLARRRGDYAAAERLAQRALARLRRAGAAWHAANVRGNLGILYYRTGRLEEALSCFREAERWGRALRHPCAVNVARANMATIHLAAGQLQDAEALLVSTLEAHLRSGISPEIALVQLNLGRVRCEQGRLAEAEQLLLRASDRAARVGQQRERAFALLYLGWISLARQRTGEGRRRLELAREGFEEMGAAREVRLTRLFECAGCAPGGVPSQEDDPLPEYAALLRAHAERDEDALAALRHGPTYAGTSDLRLLDRLASRRHPGASMLSTA
ncbi:MAG: winged helix-turn-helix domain-containing protein [Alphaproteobacteria bacterium]|nr:winged helix-turn-helix domain-containing protein [Alphaproteobacteria bacterium]